MTDADTETTGTDRDEQPPSVPITIRRSALGSPTEAGQTGHWDGAFASSRVRPEELEALRAYFAAAVVAVQEALDRRKVAEAEAFRAGLRAEKTRPKTRTASALEEFLQGL